MSHWLFGLMFTFLNLTQILPQKTFGIKMLIRVKFPLLRDNKAYRGFRRPCCGGYSWSHRLNVTRMKDYFVK